MKQYQPNTPFDVPFKVLTLTKTFINGINTQNYKETEDTYFCGVKSYGGTEKVINDVYVVGVVSSAPLAAIFFLNAIFYLLLNFSFKALFESVR